MFGYAAFAQAPYASLGGNAYAVSINESATFTDVDVIYATFLGNAAESF